MTHPMDAALDAGTLLEGRFEVVKPVAAGGMGQVYLAIDRETGTSVAVKTTGTFEFFFPRLLHQHLTHSLRIQPS